MPSSSSQLLQPNLRCQIDENDSSSSFSSWSSAFLRDRPEWFQAFPHAVLSRQYDGRSPSSPLGLWGDFWGFLRFNPSSVTRRAIPPVTDLIHTLALAGESDSAIVK